jgi:hypothetical protein
MFDRVAYCEVRKTAKMRLFRCFRQEQQEALVSVLGGKRYGRLQRTRT